MWGVIRGGFLEINGGVESNVICPGLGGPGEP